jgi:hypothetical protein
VTSLASLASPPDQLTSILLPGSYIIAMELEDINGAFTTQTAAVKKTMHEMERVDDSDGSRSSKEVVDHDAEKRLVRKLDIW